MIEDLKNIRKDLVEASNNNDHILLGFAINRLDSAIHSYSKLLKEGSKPDGVGIFSEKDMEKAYKNGARDAISKGYGTFNLENYR